MLAHLITGDIQERVIFVHVKLGPFSYAPVFSNVGTLPNHHPTGLISGINRKGRN